VALLVASMPAWTQSTQPASAASPATSQQQLDQLLAPIALYPDALLVQILMASTYPLEVVMASRWSKANPGLKDKALEDAMQKQAWDPSVKGLTAVPKVLERLGENIDWMHKLGDAFLADQAAVMKTVQALRKKAQDAGNLKSTAEQTVRTETQADTKVIIIEPAQPDVVYVPTYDPAYVYGPWWYSYPPYYMYPPGYYYGTGMAFAAGVFWGAAIWGGANWGGNNVHIDHHRYNNFNRTNVGNGNWGHQVDHRKGVAYGDSKVAQQYNRGGDRAKVQSREQFRARADSGRANCKAWIAASWEARAHRIGCPDRPGIAPAAAADRAPTLEASAAARRAGAAVTLEVGATTLRADPAAGFRGPGHRAAPPAAGAARAAARWEAVVAGEAAEEGGDEDTLMAHGDRDRTGPDRRRGAGEEGPGSRQGSGAAHFRDA
jgi:hypothetical protein